MSTKRSFPKSIPFLYQQFTPKSMPNQEFKLQCRINNRKSSFVAPPSGKERLTSSFDGRISVDSTAGIPSTGKPSHSQQSLYLNKHFIPPKKKDSSFNMYSSGNRGLVKMLNGDVKSSATMKKINHSQKRFKFWGSAVGTPGNTSG